MRFRATTLAAILVVSEGAVLRIHAFGFAVGGLVSHFGF